MSSARRSSAFSTASSTRAATATASPARMRRTGQLVPKGTVEPYVVLAARRQPARRDGRARIAAAGDDRCPRWSGKLPARLDYNVEMALQTRIARLRRRAAPGPDTGSCASRCRGIARRFRRQRRIQLRVGRRRIPPTARAARSISSIRRRTTSTAWPIRWAGATSTTCAPGFEITPFKATADHRRTITRGGWPRTRDALYAASGAVLARVPAGAAQRHVGQELDVQVARPLTPQLAARRRLRAHLPRRRSSSRRRRARPTAARS